MRAPISVGTPSFEGFIEDLRAAQYFGNGALLIDEFDNLILDDIRRESVLWNRIDKRLAPGETTGGFDQTGIASGRAAPRRSLGWTPTGPTRAARTPKIVKAIVADTTFGIFDRSVYQQQGRRFGDLEAKDVQDLYSACIRQWASEGYLGNSGGGAGDEFDGLRVLLASGAATIHAADSIINGFKAELLTLTNNKDILSRPTGIYTNAVVVDMINMEMLAIGDKILYAPIKVGETVFDCAQLATPVGYMPLITDPWNQGVAGTPVVYPSFILDETKVSWQYIEVLGAAGADPKTFEIAMTNGLDVQYKAVMFGAMEILGPTRQHKRVNVEERTTVVQPVVPKYTTS